MLEVEVPLADSGVMTLPTNIALSDRALIGYLWSRMESKRAMNHLRASYYAGKRHLKQVSDIVPPAYYNLNLVLGWCAKPVDMLAQRVNLDRFAWPGGDLDDVGLPDLFDGQDLISDLDAAQVASLVHGVTYLVNVPGYPGEPASQVHAYDALRAYGLWNQRSRRLDALLTVDEVADGQPVRFALHTPGKVTDFRVTATSYDIIEHETGWNEVLAEPLVYKPRVGHHFGYSRITRASMGLTDAAIRALIRLEGHLDIYSYPELYLLGTDMSIFQNDDGSLNDLMRARMGRIKTLPDDDVTGNRIDLKQFPAASPEPHLAALSVYAKLFARENSLPDTAFAITDTANPTSAEAYNASQFELIAEAERTARQWSRPIRRTIQRALAIQNGFTEIPTDYRKIECLWRDPRFMSRAQEADAGLKTIQAAPWLAETTVGLSMLGLSETQIDLALSERQQAEDRQLTQSLLELPPLPSWQPEPNHGTD
ncbi:MAG: phage portal protein [Promicromonosporaceae bacterium]|nr:phage portal protein [Promicromonosporaceae bacterium]